MWRWCWLLLRPFARSHRAPNCCLWVMARCGKSWRIPAQALFLPACVAVKTWRPTMPVPICFCFQV